MKNSKFLTLNLKDFSKGLLISVLVALLSFIQDYLSAGTFNFSDIDWQKILNLAILAGISYILKNLVTNSNGQLGAESVN